MKTDILVSDLIDYLPHREPMIWVDRVIEVGDNYKQLSGVCVIDVNDKALYMATPFTLFGSSTVEFTAQAYGYLKAAFQKLHQFDDPPKNTFLAGIKHCESRFSEFKLKPGSELTIHVQVVRDLKPICFIRGEIRCSGRKEALASAEIQVYYD